MSAPTFRLKSGIGWITLQGYSAIMIGIEGRGITLSGVKYDFDARLYLHTDGHWHFTRPAEQGGEGAVELYVTRRDTLTPARAAVNRIREAIDRDFQFAILSAQTRQFRQDARAYGLESERIIAQMEYTVFAARVEKARQRLDLCEIAV